MGIETFKVNLSGSVAAGGTFLVPYPSGMSATNYVTTDAKMVDSAGNVYDATVLLGAGGVTVTNPTGRVIGQKDMGHLQLTTDDVGPANSDVIGRPAYYNAAGTALVVGGDEVPIAGTPCEVYGASPSASAATNTAAIQAALDAAAVSGGTVTLYTPGTFLINSPLIIGSNTHFRLGPETEIKQAANINKNLLRNNAYANLATLGKSITSLTFSGELVTAVCEGHELQTGEWVAITGDQTYGHGSITAGYGGVFRATRVDDDTFTYIPGKTIAASATGTLKAVKADENITISGGKWNHNGAENALAGSSTFACATEFFFIRGLFIDGAHFYNESGLKYAIHGGTINFLHINNVLLDTDSDGIHIKGPLINANIENIQGRVKDDGIILNNRDTWPGGFGGQYLDISGGNIENCRICNIALESPYSAVSLFPFDPAYSMENILVDNVIGNTFTAVKIWGEYTVNHYSGKVSNVRLSRLGVHKIPSQLVNLVNIIDVTNADIITISDIDLPKLDAAQLANSSSFISLSGNLGIEKLVLEKISGRGLTGANRLLYIAPGGTVNVEEIYLRDMVFEQASGNARVVRLDGGTYGKVMLDGFRTLNGDNIVSINIGVVLPLIEISNSYFNSCWIVVSTPVNCNIKITDSHYHGGNAFINCSTASQVVSVFAKGATFSGSGSKLINGGASTAISVYGLDAQIDVGANGIAKTAGAYCFNIGSGRGTLTQNRLVACNGANWFQLDNPSLVF